MPLKAWTRDGQHRIYLLPLQATAQANGAVCSSEAASPIGNTPADCDQAYPGVCIAPPPPELDCGNIPHRRFKVLLPDPHGFDRDRDGIGFKG